MKRMWYNNKWVVLLLHSAAWILLFTLPALLRPPFNPNETAHPRLVNETANFIIWRINDAVLISFFYFNSLLLVPQLLYRKKYALFFSAVLGCLAFYVFQGWILRINFTPEKFLIFRRHLFFSIFIFMFILACSIAYRTIRDRIISDKIATEKENEFLKTELSLLRSQVSPALYVQCIK